MENDFNFISQSLFRYLFKRRFFRDFFFQMMKNRDLSFGPEILLKPRKKKVFGLKNLKWSTENLVSQIFA